MLEKNLSINQKQKGAILSFSPSNVSLPRDYMVVAYLFGVLIVYVCMHKWW